ncbi:MAG: SH3 domain-containing protein [Verrucomicrobiota bacterium]|jgi:uncharacterized protein YgiM (DUF1202 family)
MRWHSPFAGIIFSLVVLAPAGVGAPSTAVVNRDHVNIRAQATMTAEIIAQLQKGETVTVLDTAKNPGASGDEPAAWSKIVLPADTPVWVYAPSIDPATKAVRVPKLNVRAGPGSNFSAIGSLTKGTVVSDIRVLDQWMEVTAPSSSFAYVAAQFLDPTNAAPAQAHAATKPVPSTETAPPPPVATTPPPLLPRPVTTERPTVVPAVPPPATNEPAPPVNAKPEPPTPAPTAAAEPKPEVAPPATDPTRKRIVSREGIVRDTLSIQAPTDYELVGADTGKVLNYLLPASPAIKLRPYHGQRIIVTGEEQFDPRWKVTPMIVVQTIELAP